LVAGYGLIWLRVDLVAGCCLRPTVFGLRSTINGQRSSAHDYGVMSAELPHRPTEKATIQMPVNRHLPNFNLRKMIHWVHSLPFLEILTLFCDTIFLDEEL
jgi:hypothetical protein